MQYERGFLAKMLKKTLRNAFSILQSSSSEVPPRPQICAFVNFLKSVNEGYEGAYFDKRLS